MSSGVVRSATEKRLAACAGNAAPDALLVDFRLRDGEGPVRRRRAPARARDSHVAAIIPGEISGQAFALIKASGSLPLHKPATPARMRASRSHLLTQASDAA